MKQVFSQVIRQLHVEGYYTDGTKASVEQMARDVTTFLAWASEPNLEQRKGMGFKVVLFLVVFLGLIIAVKKRVWSNVH